MAGNSYPHIVFAKDAEVLPPSRLEDVLTRLASGATVHHGEIKTDLRLPDGWTYTFWYDDGAEGLGERYAEYAAPLRRKRVTRCSTMIDASGEVDAEQQHAATIGTIMETLAGLDGVYVFSETTKRFTGMDYEDAPETATPVAEATGRPEPVVGAAHAPVTQPELDPRQPVSPPAHAPAEQSEVILDDRTPLPADHPMYHQDLPGHMQPDGQADPTPTVPPAPETWSIEQTPMGEPRVEERPAAAAHDGAPVDEPSRVESPQHDHAGADAAAGSAAGPVDEPAATTPVAPQPAPTPASAPASPTTPAPEPTVADTPAAPTVDTGSPRPVEPVAPATAAPAAPATPAAPAPRQEEKKGFFKKLFGRKN